MRRSQHARCTVTDTTQNHSAGGGKLPSTTCGWPRQELGACWFEKLRLARTKNLRLAISRFIQLTQTSLWGAPPPLTLSPATRAAEEQPAPFLPPARCRGSHPA
eukprot:GHRQ01032712.1.p1 GENE.GHRQ01032712.1~~GHRQ01032712.1.p1  ORF type:complete len:104 (+),score=0.69 GHRQ01032712.1:402-713(+)